MSDKPVFSVRVSPEMYEYIETRRIETNLSRSNIITHLLTQSHDYQVYLRQLKDFGFEINTDNNPVAQAERIMLIEQKINQVLNLILTRNDRTEGTSSNTSLDDRILSLEQKVNQILNLIELKTSEKEASLTDKLNHVKSVLTQLIRDYQSNSVQGIKRNSFTQGIKILEDLVFDL